MIDLYSLSHFLQVWIFPPGVILLLLLLILLLNKRYPFFTRSLLLVTIVLFWLVSTPFIAQQLVNYLQNQYSPLNAEAKLLDPKHSAIVVLGAGVETGLEYSTKSTVSEKTLSRLNYAVYLHQQLGLPMIVSGGNRKHATFTEGKEMRQVLNQYYHAPVIFEETKSRTTREESEYLQLPLKQHGITTIYLVTNAWHMPRSMYIFTKNLTAQGIKIIPAPMGYVSLGLEDALLNWLPLLNALNVSVMALHEYVGLIWYGLR
jgi:uncharacterized SAM-binding protein YcdF (DUF218 family)